jgi:hypothetical protein
MSVVAFTPASNSIGARLHALLTHLVPEKTSHGRLYRDLKNLPDHLLLDIGIDPRNVPGNTEAEIARPDLVHRGVGATVFRTVAKS